MIKVWMIIVIYSFPMLARQEFFTGKTFKTEDQCMAVVKDTIKDGNKAFCVETFDRIITPSGKEGKK
jgi:hypothetical protein